MAASNIVIPIVSQNAQTATLIGIPVALHDHTSYISATASAIRSIYGSSASISSYTSIANGEYVVGYMANSDITAFRGHGASDGIALGDESDPEMPALLMDDLGIGESRIFANSKLILYCCCSCGEGGETADNLVTATYHKGAQNVIGFKGTVYCSEANEWIEDFFSRLSSYSQVDTDAITSVLAGMRSTYVGKSVSHSNTLFMYQQY